MDKQTLDFITHYALTCYNYSGDCKEEKIIASLIYSYMQGARILDMGCGPVSPILAQFFPEATDLVAFDKLPENIAFMQKYSDRISHIISQAAEYRLDTFGSKPPVLHSVEYFVGDVLDRYPIGLFDAVMQVGCFACLHTPEQFQCAVHNAVSYLRPGGHLLMINWFSDSVVERPYDFNGYVDPMPLFVPSLQVAGCDVLDCQTILDIDNDTKDMGYDGMIWAVAVKK